ncbi:hypothetical protein WR25_02784 [Diploscapter pachys]|uniref:Uncharacterized protein n=1 Tax=Diploscapter pachys TaxID=2018661 RepID=A0A2A2KML9_9BILA|nr:hypothetical protein WR25_02784 [Diploscapter pachys]
MKEAFRADFEKLIEIQKTYEQLDRKDEFISIFRRVTVNRLREFKKDANSIQELLDALLNEVHLLYTHNLKVLRRFLAEKEATDLLVQAIMQGLKEVKLGDTLNHLVTTSTDTGVEQSPIETINNINKIIAQQRTKSISAGDATFHEICSHIGHTVLGELVTPLKASLTSMILAKTNPLDLQSSSGSHRSRVDALKAAQAQLLQLFQDIFVAAAQLFGPEHVKDVVQQSIDKGIENLLAKMKNWEYWLDRNKRPRELDDVVLIAAASGQFCYGLQDFNDMLEQSQTQICVNLKSAQRWNRSVCEKVLNTACQVLMNKLEVGIQNAAKNPTNLGSLATSPNEYVTALGQELLQFFHRWEQFWLDDNVVHAFYLCYKKKYEGIFLKIFKSLNYNQDFS